MALYIISESPLAIIVILAQIVIISTEEVEKIKIMAMVIGIETAILQLPETGRTVLIIFILVGFLVPPCLLLQRFC